MTSLPLPRRRTFHFGLGSARLRARVWRCRYRLTRQLAEGADPTASLELALRAWQLVEPRRRGRLARSIDRVLADAQKPAGLTAAAPLRRREVTLSRPVLVEVAARLRDPAPLAARGVAQALLLLTDCDSPVYAPAAPGALSHKASGILTVLEER